MLGVGVHQVPVIKNQVGESTLPRFSKTSIAGASEDPMRQLELIPKAQATCNGSDVDTVQYKDSDQLRPFHEPPRPPRKGNPSPPLSSSPCL